MPSERIVELLGAQPMGTDGAPKRNLVLDEEDEAAGATMALGDAVVASINKHCQPFQLACTAAHDICNRSMKGVTEKVSVQQDPSCRTDTT